VKIGLEIGLDLENCFENWFGWYKVQGSVWMGAKIFVEQQFIPLSPHL